MKQKLSCVIKSNEKKNHNKKRNEKRLFTSREEKFTSQIHSVVAAVGLSRGSWAPTLCLRRPLRLWVLEQEVNKQLMLILMGQLEQSIFF